MHQNLKNDFFLCWKKRYFKLDQKKLPKKSSIALWFLIENQSVKLRVSIDENGSKLQKLSQYVEYT